VTQQTRL